jgi:hypothetical protein
LLVTLLLLFGVSAAVFVWQVRRWTLQPGWRALLDWSRERGFKLSRPQPRRASRSTASPGAGDDDAGVDETTRCSSNPAGCRRRGRRRRGGRSVAMARARPRSSAPPGRRRGCGPRTCRRACSISFAFELSRDGRDDRFIVFGTDSAAARMLSKSHARALLPPDIGLLLHGRHVVLDFSTRPFDGIELGRMVALADQLVRHLPGV